MLPDRHAVCRLSRRDRMPAWATNSTRGISSITRTADELSIIVLDSVAPRNVRCERNWRVIRVRGPLPFDLIGIISGISGTLANSGISIFAFSTFDTDYVMVKAGDLDRALNALRRAEYPIVDPTPRKADDSQPVKPVDEGVTDPDFFLFRARLQTALAKHDTAEVMRIVDPGILNSFGGDGGRAEFREHWGLGNPDQSQLWGALAFVLALGGRFLGDTLFYAPYTMHDVSGDGFETLVVLGSNVTVHAGPAPTFGVIDTLAFEAVTKWREKSTTAGWEPIRTSTSKTGWVLQRHVRSPIDYRAGFVRRQGRWWLRALVAGD
ncbi:MAG TPA: ACT domain-containing protein [Gemmatimonadales bacterium]